jgi:hypothetical protein
MLDYLKGKASDRKIRLFAVWCCINHPDANREASFLSLIDAFVDRLDNKLSDQEWFDVFSNAGGVRGIPLRIQHMLAHDPFTAANRCSKFSYGLSFRLNHPEIITADDVRKCTALQKLVGNPFRAIKFIPSWLTTTVVSLASGIYEEKAFDRMPILADALQDAGCDNEDILNHCRQPGEHVRGCWVVDLLLGKS